MATTKSGITCPKCDSETRVLETDISTNQTRRIRLCLNEDCRHAFKSVEDRMRCDELTVPTEDHHRGLPCPDCGGSTSVQQTRRAAGQIRRYRQCQSCEHTFKTKERSQR